MVVAVDIQNRMVQIFEELKNLEVKLQNNRLDLDKAIGTERSVFEGVVEVSGRLKDYKSSDLIEIGKFAAMRKDLETVERFLEQSKAHRIILEATKTALIRAQKMSQANYDSLGTQLAKMSDNVLFIVQS